MNKLDRSQFLKEVKEKFPELKTKLNAQEGLLSFEVDVFVSFIQSKIDDGDKAALARLLEIADRYFTDGNKAMSELIRNGFCEDLVFEDSKKHFRSWAKAMLPVGLANERKEWLTFMGFRDD